jgi:hypothetical protein
MGGGGYDARREPEFNLERARDTKRTTCDTGGLDGQALSHKENPAEITPGLQVGLNRFICKNALLEAIVPFA